MGGNSYSIIYRKVGGGCEGGGGENGRRNLHDQSSQNLCGQAGFLSLSLLVNCLGGQPVQEQCE